MIEQKVIDQPRFAVCLGDNERNQSLEITFGGIDQRHFEGDVVHLPVSRKGHWEASLTSFAFEDQEVQLEDTTAISDTGTAGVVLPSSLAEMINHQLGVVVDDRGHAEVDCEKRQTGPNVTFTFGGKSFSLSSQDYILRPGGSKKSCASAFLGYDLPPPGPVVVLGDTFLRRWYSVFDVGNHTIGLAKAF